MNTPDLSQSSSLDTGSFVSMNTDQSVAHDMEHQGCAHLGTFQLAEDTRLSATRYSQEQYKLKFLDDAPKELRMFPSYHFQAEEEELGGTMEVRKALRNKQGTLEDRERFLSSIRANGVHLSEDERKALNDWVEAWQPGEALSEGSRLRSVALAYRYDSSRLDNTSPTSPFHYVRGFYYSPAWSSIGVISGRSDPNGPDIPSTPEEPWIDGAVRDNFVTVKQPGSGTEQKKSQQGVFWMPAGLVDDQSEQAPLHGLWSVPYNDTFFLSAIHYQQPVMLASRRSRDNLFRPNTNIGQRIMGRELAMLMGSQAYELHISQELGETFVFSGAPKGSEFGFPELPEIFEQYSEDPVRRESLLWLNDLSSLNLNMGDVVVQVIEKKAGDDWVCTRDLHALPEAAPAGATVDA